MFSSKRSGVIAAGAAAIALAGGSYGIVTATSGPASATVSAVTAGEPVLVLGTTDSTTITATQVILQPPSTSGSNPGGQVIGFSKGTKGSSEQVGQIPADYQQG